MAVAAPPVRPFSVEEHDQVVVRLRELTALNARYRADLAILAHQHLLARLTGHDDRGAYVRYLRALDVWHADVLPEMELLQHALLGSHYLEMAATHEETPCTSTSTPSSASAVPPTR